MCKRTRHTSNKFMVLLLAVVLACGMLPVQSLAAEINSVSVDVPEKTETDDQTNVSEEENNYPAEESLAGDEVAGQEGEIIITSGQTFEVPPAEEDTIWLKESEQGVLSSESCIVAFDPDDGKTGYENFYKVTVPVGSTVTGRPEKPVREGYIFKGWYAYLDEEGNPVLWNFESDTVTENTTLWAAWEEACLVVFDPDDGETGYKDFYKVMVPKGSTVTDQPEKPVREGYVFKGWYAYLDEEGNPVLWDFASDTVTENTTLWAAWEEEDNDGGENCSGNSGGNGNGNGSENNSNSGGNIKKQVKAPTGKSVKSINQNNVPKTGDSASMLLWMLCGVSVSGMAILILLRNKKHLYEVNGH